MAQVHHVQKARKSPGPCQKCGAKIRKGHSYKWWKFRYGGKRIRCDAETCSPRPSEYVTSSDKLSRCMGAGEMVEGAIAAFKKDLNLAKLVEEVESAAEEVREVAGEYQESSENMESGLGHETEQSEELAEKSQNLESKADEIEQAAGELRAFEDWKKTVSDESLKKLWVQEIEADLQEYTDIDPEG